MHKQFGLVGKNISYSFSQGYFTEKFKNLGLTDYSYVNFDLQEIEGIKDVIENTEGLAGFNITIPYKEAIFPYLTDIDAKAKEIGAVNVVKVTKNGLKGYNTDVVGFEQSIRPFIKPHHTKALILGTGGASKAVAYAMKSMGIDYTFVSRNASEGKLNYAMLTEEIMKTHTVIINCTPLGTFPNTEQKPDIPYQYITDKHLIYDLIYNPSETTFMKLSKNQGATAINGHEMLKLQAEAAWKIWNE